MPRSQERTGVPACAGVWDRLAELALAGRAAESPVDRERAGIFGHSMGGHGALVCALKNPERYRSLSAFAPISSPMRCPWGEKSFSGYLGADRATWRAYDATELAKTARWSSEVLVDQGTADDFLDEQLKPELLQEAFRAAGIPLTLRYQAGYDHSYYFMASFIADHDFVYLVEQNRDGQLRSLIVNECGIDPVRLVPILHYDGTPITARFIEKAIGDHLDQLKVAPAKRVGV